MKNITNISWETELKAFSESKLIYKNLLVRVTKLSIQNLSLYKDILL